MPAKSSRSEGAKLLEKAEHEARAGKLSYDSVALPAVNATVEVYTTIHYRVSFGVAGDGTPRPEPIDDISDWDALCLLEAAEFPDRFASVVDEIRNEPTAVKLRAMRTLDRLTANGIATASRRRVSAAAGALV